MKNETNVMKESYITGSYSHRKRELKIGTNSLYLANKIDNVYYQRKSQTRCPGLTSSRRLLYIFSTQTTLEQTLSGLCFSLLTRVASATTKSGRATKMASRILHGRREGQTRGNSFASRAQISSNFNR